MIDEKIKQEFTMYKHKVEKRYNLQGALAFLKALNRIGLLPLCCPLLWNMIQHLNPFLNNRGFEHTVKWSLCVNQGTRIS